MRAAATTFPSVGVFVWRLKSYTVTNTPAYCYEGQAPNCYLFSPLGNDTALFVNPQPNTAASAPDLALPTPIRRRVFEIAMRATPEARLVSGVPFYYGEGQEPDDLDRLDRQTGAGDAHRPGRSERLELSAAQATRSPSIRSCGRIMFPPGQTRRQAVWVSYSYGFSADIGGGEYARPIRQPAGATVYQVGAGLTFTSIGDALAKWSGDKPVERRDRDHRQRRLHRADRVELAKDQTLQLRAANGKRPVIRLLDWQTSAPGQPQRHRRRAELVRARRRARDRTRHAGSRRRLGRRHPPLARWSPAGGWTAIASRSGPTEPSLELIDAPLCITIEHSIVGAIQVERDEAEPRSRRRSRSATASSTRPSDERIALGAPGKLCAYRVLIDSPQHGVRRGAGARDRARREQHLHGRRAGCRRQIGCMRFCYVPPGSRTPRRYHCQPDLVEQAVAAFAAEDELTPTSATRCRERTPAGRARVQQHPLRPSPPIASLPTTAPTRSRAAPTTSPRWASSTISISRSAWPISRTRLDEYTPAGIDAGIIFAN